MSSEPLGPGAREAAPAFANWLDRFFVSYYTRRPVNATFIGIHHHDARLPDFSEHGAGDTVAEMRGLLQESAAFHGQALSGPDRIDLLLARGFLETQLWEYQSSHFHLGNPALYTGEAIFGAMALFLTEFAPLATRVDSAIDRLEAVPAFLAQARANVRRAPAAWTERALRECAGAAAFLTGGIDLLLASNGIKEPHLRSAADQALEAFGEFEAHLESTLRNRPSDRYAAGEEAFGLYLEQGHFLAQDAEEIVRSAEAELAEAQAYLRDHAGDRAGPAVPRTPEAYYRRYQEVWDAVRAAAEAHDLLTWPNCPIRFVPRPAWTRAAAPHLYFLSYRSPAAFNRPAVHDYLVTPIDSGLPIERERELFAAGSESGIKLNHVIHHGSIGHHVQNWYAFRSRSRIGRIAAVDCASRIAMFSGGTMAEGWACYATDLMDEVDFLTAAERYEEYETRCRMCARAVVDVRLHHGRYPIEQAADYYHRQTGMPAEAARAEAVKNSMFPGAAIIYLMGGDGIHQLRREIAAERGARFSLRAFHDELLSYGSIPVALIAEDMKRRVDR